MLNPTVAHPIPVPSCANVHSTGTPPPPPVHRKTGESALPSTTTLPTIPTWKGLDVPYAQPLPPIRSPHNARSDVALPDPIQKLLVKNSALEGIVNHDAKCLEPSGLPPVRRRLALGIILPPPVTNQTAGNASEVLDAGDLPPPIKRSSPDKELTFLGLPPPLKRSQDLPLPVRRGLGHDEAHRGNLPLPLKCQFAHEGVLVHDLLLPSKCHPAKEVAGSDLPPTLKRSPTNMKFPGADLPVPLKQGPTCDDGPPVAVVLPLPVRCDPGREGGHGGDLPFPIKRSLSQNEIPGGDLPLPIKRNNVQKAVPNDDLPPPLKRGLGDRQVPSSDPPLLDKGSPGYEEVQDSQLLLPILPLPVKRYPADREIPRTNLPLPLKRSIFNKEASGSLPLPMKRRVGSDVLHGGDLHAPAQPLPDDKEVLGYDLPPPIKRRTAEDHNNMGTIFTLPASTPCESTAPLGQVPQSGSLNLPPVRRRRLQSPGSSLTDLPAPANRISTREENAG